MEEVRRRNLPNLTLLVVGKPITFLCDSGTTYTVITRKMVVIYLCLKQPGGVFGVVSHKPPRVGLNGKIGPVPTQRGMHAQRTDTAQCMWYTSETTPNYW